MSVLRERVHIGMKRAFNFTFVSIFQKCMKQWTDRVLELIEEEKLKRRMCKQS